MWQCLSFVVTHYSKREQAGGPFCFCTQRASAVIFLLQFCCVRYSKREAWRQGVLFGWKKHNRDWDLEKGGWKTSNVHSSHTCFVAWSGFEFELVGSFWVCLVGLLLVASKVTFEGDLLGGAASAFSEDGPEAAASPRLFSITVSTWKSST